MVKLFRNIRGNNIWIVSPGRGSCLKKLGTENPISHGTRTNEIYQAKTSTSAKHPAWNLDTPQSGSCEIRLHTAHSLRVSTYIPQSWFYLCLLYRDIMKEPFITWLLRRRKLRHASEWIHFPPDEATEGHTISQEVI